MGDGYTIETGLFEGGILQENGLKREQYPFVENYMQVMENPQKNSILFSADGDGKMLFSTMIEKIKEGTKPLTDIDFKF